MTDAAPIRLRLSAALTSNAPRPRRGAWRGSWPLALALLAGAWQVPAAAQGTGLDLGHGTVIDAPPPPVAAKRIPVEEAPLEADGPASLPAAAAPPAAAKEQAQRGEEEMLLLETRLGPLTLADALPGYLNGSSLLLPLRGVAEMLEFPIGVDTSNGTASGWFIRENKLFYLNVQRGSVVVEGRESAFDAALAEIRDDDIYVDSRLLAQWFPIDISFEIATMLVELKSREPLPVEEKLARDTYRKRLFGGGDKGEDYPRAETPRKLADWPMLSLDTDTRLTKPQDGRGDFVTDYNLMSSADLGYMNAELFTAGDNRQKITESRLRFDRKDPDGRALGVLNDMTGDVPVTEMSFGDIYSPEIPLVARTQAGRGFTMSSIPLNAPTEFDKTTLTGDLPLGWEVELYRNEVLIAFQASSTDGRYTFTDIPLMFGVNVMKLVFYGPQGQSRQEIRQFRVGEGLVKPGEVQFRVSGNQHDERMLYKRRTTENSLEGDARMFAEAHVGVTQNVSAGFNTAVLPTALGQQRYVGLSSSTTLGDIYTRGDFVKQQDNGWSGRVSGQTSLAGLSVIAQHDHYHDFFSEYTPNSADPLTSSSKLRLDGSIAEGFLPRISTGLTADHSIRRSKATDTSLTQRLSLPVGRASVTNSFTAGLARDAQGAVDKTLTGSLLVGGRIEDFRVRGQVGYQVAPIKELTTVSLSGDWHINGTYQGRAGVTHALGDSATSSTALGGTSRTAYTVGAMAAFDQIYAGLSFDYTDTREMIGRLTLNFSLTRDPANGGINFARGNIANKGAVSARVFLDHDADGKFSEGDEPLHGIGFTSDGSPIKGRTDDNGYAYVVGLEPYREIVFAVDEATLSDPYWIAMPGGRRLVARAGTTGSYEFPVVSTGEIDGTAYRAWSDGTQAAAGVIMQLVDAEGQVTRELTTAYDGFFLFDFVAPGHYTLRVSPDQLATLGLRADEGHPLVIQGDGTVVSGQDFVLR